MDQVELEQIISLAESASAKVSDSTLKEQTYKIVLTELLRQRTGISGGPSIGAENQYQGNQQVHAPRPGAKGDTPAAKVATWVGIEEDALSEIFEFSDNGVAIHLPHTILPTKAADAQRLLAHMKLSVDRIGYDADEVSSKDLITIFDDHGCKDANLAKNLKASEYIISKGGKGAMKSYKLRYTGMSAALTEIQNVLGAGS
jgi:hypothetical protein